ncbi:cyclic GMP-AMP synthase DncV-like nucleotidyltransferase [Psychrobacter sp. M13]|uniref:nucleotide-binding domain-containing protein n=1 Tax=Psychrobacter sp. M13 TaxID=3067275 RepID=UPI00273BBAE7|nr:nucleotidyltransferase [Psychrobacter sp. M13]WLP94500.1 nucleotidyltransferase [Psychrobacter sp. M13]
MFDCSKEFQKFYKDYVKLSEQEKNVLRDKRDKNIKRLIKGLEKYNNDKNTSYKVAESRTQGSMAMHTIVQNDKKDYDIDVAIVFESEHLGELGAQAARNIIANALKREMSQFSEEPEVKTGCVRVRYTTGYHIDFAIFKRSKHFEWQEEYSYEYAGDTWSVRDIKALDDWFIDEIKAKTDNLRKVVRLSKMFCKSRDTWGSLPSGLIQTILCSENFDSIHSRIDENFYHTLKSIRNRLEWNLQVNAPNNIDNSRLITTRQVDLENMRRWKDKLSTQLEKLDILFESDCTYQDAISAWGEFFNHDYWSGLGKSTVKITESLESRSYKDTEEFIGELYLVLERYSVDIDCQISGNGFRDMSVFEYLTRYAPTFERFVPFNCKVKCKVGNTDCPSYDKVLWKVRNVGEIAERKNCIRGQIQERTNEIIEPTSFKGRHYIECYLIKGRVCVAIGRVDVPIGQE